MTTLSSVMVGATNTAITALLSENKVIDDVIIDAVIKETHNRTSRVTSHVTEDGANLQDHIIQEPVTIQIDFMMGNVVPVLSRIARVGARTISNAVAKATGQPTVSYVYGAENMFDRLEKVWKNRKLLTIKTDFKSYDNMAITSIAMDTSAPYKKSLNCSVSFQQVTTVNLNAKTSLIKGMDNVTGFKSAMVATKEFLGKLGF